MNDQLIRRLIKNWRTVGMKHCADELEAALAPLSGPVDASGEPPSHVIDLAVEVSGWSPCRSKRGVVIFSEGDVISHGYNYKPRGFDCDGSDTCKATCRREAIHAEQQALMAAGNRAHASQMLHVKTVGGKLVPSGGPSCVECSKLARAAGIAWFWLYHDTGWRRYEMAEFHALSIVAAAVPSSPAQEQDDELRDELREAVMHYRQEVERLKTIGLNQYGEPALPPSSPVADSPIKNEVALATPSCPDHGPMRLISAQHVCDTCGAFDEFMNDPIEQK